MPHKPIDPIAIENVITLAKAYAKSRDPEYKLSSVSTQAHGDPQFLPRLIKGKGSMTFRKYDSVMQFFEANWPKNVVRPKIRPLEPAKAR